VDLEAQVLWSGIHGVVSLMITFRAEQFPRVPPRPGLAEASIEATLHGLLVDRDEEAR
jgi:hypothetical protein